MRAKKALRQTAAAGGAAAVSVLNQPKKVAAPEITRETKIAQVIANEEKRQSDSQVAGITMDVDQQI